MLSRYTKPYRQIRNTDVALVGGKNASLGEMFQQLGSKGINIPDGFATTADAFRYFLEYNQLTDQIHAILNTLDTEQFSNLKKISDDIRSLVLQGKMPDDLAKEIVHAFHDLKKTYGENIHVAVRSSATAEDLPNASFAGQHDSFLNVSGDDGVVMHVQKCFASLYNARAIKYRHDNGFEHAKVLLSAGVQLMVRSDLSSSGVCFTLEPESGFRDVVVISGCWGLGENIVQGNVNPDEFHVFKPTLAQNKNAIISKKLGSKAKTMIYDESGAGLVNIDTPEDKQQQWSLSDDEILTIGKWCVAIEEHYKMPMDIEWAKDGQTGRLFIVQARPETVHALAASYVMKEYTLQSKGKTLVSGNAVGSGIAKGVARIIHSTAEADKLKQGEVLVTDNTNPDWDPIMKKAAAIITNKGGRTSHAAIVAREIGTVAVVGCNNATEVIKDGQEITVSCAQGKTGVIYDGLMNWQEKEIDFRNVIMPETAPMLILGDPEKAYRYSFYPNRGVGLMRLEFIINNAIRIHPMALVKFNELKDLQAKDEIEKLTHHYQDKEHYFVDKLALSVATIAAAFYPKDVIVRMSDFKTNEYSNLIGGHEFEPEEENPMLGFRGASRYYHERYREGFRLECEAMKKVRDEMGLTNVKLMIPFCRTIEEGKKVIEEMSKNGLQRGENGLEVYVMAEIPANVILAKEFAKIFDGFSIGSNDLTQLTLGLDRDSSIVSELFDENNTAVKIMIAAVIREAKLNNVKIGLCGQAPSDFPEFAAFLVQQGINSISYNPDALLRGIQNMYEAEQKMKVKAQ
ncbi:MAG: phosphoenolpyruvate synthase [Bacteroidia bacterium]